MRFASFLLLALALSLVGCGGEGEPTVHTVRGRVAKVLADGGELVVDHEDIPGFMSAMQMSFTVGDPAEARDLQPGEKVSFVLHVAERGFWIGGIEKLPADTSLELADPDH